MAERNAMDRRSFLVRAAAIATAAALPFQRAAQLAEEVAPTPALGEVAGSPLIPDGTRLLTYETGAQGYWIGWVENAAGQCVGWLTENGVYKSVEDLVRDGQLSPLR